MSYRSFGYSVLSRQDEDYWCVSMDKCGYSFNDVMRIYDFDKSNPLIQVKQPLGLHAVLRILNFIFGSEWKGV